MHFYHLILNIVWGMQLHLRISKYFYILPLLLIKSLMIHSTVHMISLVCLSVIINMLCQKVDFASDQLFQVLSILSIVNWPTCKEKVSLKIMWWKNKESFLLKQKSLPITFSHTEKTGLEHSTQSTICTWSCRVI